MRHLRARGAQGEAARAPLLTAGARSGAIALARATAPNLTLITFLHPTRRSRDEAEKEVALITGVSTILVCPTSTSTPPASFHPEIEIANEATRVLCEMVGAVDARALGEHVAHLTLDEMRVVDEGLELVLDLA